jgi:hypothetical protein
LLPACTRRRSPWRGGTHCDRSHFPFIALGFPALGFIFSWLVVLTRGALFLVLPTLWLAIVLVSLQEIASELQNQNSSES